MLLILMQKNLINVAYWQSNIYYNTIEKIVANKKTYFVRVIDTKQFRFGLIEQESI